MDQDDKDDDNLDRDLLKRNEEKIKLKSLEPIQILDENKIEDSEKT